jgi:outer membrane protein OmpA-like peptidoglycan-associated protein
MISYKPFIFLPYLFLFLMVPFGKNLLAQEVYLEVRENLGPNINTQYDEVLPVITSDGKTLYFVRKDCPNNIGGPKDDIWYSTLQQDGAWGEAKNIGVPLNDEGYNYVCSIMPDNNSLLLGNQYFRDARQRQGVSIAVRTRTGWSYPRNLRIVRFSNSAKNCEYSMSPDGKVIVMSIERVDSRGERDLYVSFVKQIKIPIPVYVMGGVFYSSVVSSDYWTEPQNMGNINSASADVTPFIAADGVSLYFSSARPGGFGSNDVYVARRLDDSWKSWSEPKNLGYPTNTSGWDAYYTVPASGEYAYFVSDADGYGKSDIFRIRLPKEAKPLPVMLVKGIVKDDKGNVVAAKIEYERLDDSTFLGTANAHPHTGEYRIALKAGGLYGFRASAEGYYPVSQHIDLRNLKEYQEIKKDLILVPIITGQKVRLNNIFFDFNKDALLPESRTELDRLVEFLTEQPTTRIQINGYTDSLGSDLYNLKLSQRRAQEVVNFLVARGIERDRLQAVGHGKADPLAPNDTDEGREQNRRVEFQIF